MITAAMCAAGRGLGDACLSPDGRLVAFVAAEAGRARIVTVAAGGGPEVVLTSDPAPASARAGGSGVLAWVPEGDAVVFAGAGGGVWRQAVGGGPARCVLEGEARGVATGPGGLVAAVVDERTVVVGGRDGEPERHDGQDFAVDPAVSPDGRAVAWVAWDVPAMAWDESRIELADDRGRRVVAGGAGVSVQQPRFSPDGARLAYLSDAGSGWLNLRVLDLAGGEEVAWLREPFEHGGPTWGDGRRSFAWSPDGRALVVTRNEGGFSTLLRWDPGREPEPIGRGVHTCLSWAGDRIAAVRSGARTPTQVVVYDGDGTRRTLAVGPVAGFDDGIEPEVVSWPGDDGGEVHGLLYRAPHDTGRLLVWVHGGPTDQWQVEFRARVAFWLDRGWSILAPNHRGSTGHGRAYTQAMRGRWGELDVADVAAGARAARANGWGTTMVAMGASAGGFTVLNALARHAGLFAAGVALYPVADLRGFAEQTHRFEAHYTETLVAPGQEQDRSPLSHVAEIVDPLLLLHGTDDEVVPIGQSEAMFAALTALGRTVELHAYDGEGHGWGRPEVVVDELERTAAFLGRHA